MCEPAASGSMRTCFSMGGRPTGKTARVRFVTTPVVLACAPASMSHSSSLLPELCVACLRELSVHLSAFCPTLAASTCTSLANSMRLWLCATEHVFV